MVTTIVGGIESGDKILGIGAVTGGPVIGADNRVAVVPCINVVSIMRVGIIRSSIFCLLHLPNKAGDVVTDHGPLDRRVRQVVAVGIQFGVRPGSLVLGILAVKRLAQRRAVDGAVIVVALDLTGIGQGKQHLVGAYGVPEFITRSFISDMDAAVGRQCHIQP